MAPCVDCNIDGKILAKVDCFKYLRSYITETLKWMKRLTRIQAASFAVGRLRHRVSDCLDVTTETKLKMYNQCVIPFVNVWKRNLDTVPKTS